MHGGHFSLFLWVTTYAFLLFLYASAASGTSFTNLDSSPANETGSGYVWEPLPLKYHYTQPELSDEELYHRLEHETGLKKITSLLER